MASAFSHAVAALSIGTCLYRLEIPKRVWVVGVLCSVLPDIDAVGFRFGIHYGDFWGHRGFTHSLIFAALLSGAATATGARRIDRVLNEQRIKAEFHTPCYPTVSPHRAQHRRSAGTRGGQRIGAS